MTPHSNISIFINTKLQEQHQYKYKIYYRVINVIYTGVITYGITRLNHHLYPINMHTVLCALCCCTCIISPRGIVWSIYPYSSGLFHWHWGNRTIAPVPVKQAWREWLKLVGTWPQRNTAIQNAGIIIGVYFKWGQMIHLFALGRSRYLHMGRWYWISNNQIHRKLIKRFEIIEVKRNSVLKQMIMHQI